MAGAVTPSGPMDPAGALQAEAEIRRVIARYCRAVDRMDEELLRSCYHDDAHDEHGSFSGTVDEYVAWVWRLLGQYETTMHLIANQLVEFETARSARVETYGTAVHRGTSVEPRLNLVTGFRFVDRFERRSEWRILRRVAVTEWSVHVPAGAWWPVPESLRHGTRDRSDPAYWV